MDASASGPVGAKLTDLGPFDEQDHRLARQYQPLLYIQVTKGHVSIEHIAQAWRIRHDPSHPADDNEWRASEVLEYLARKRFSAHHRQIERDYWTAECFAGCALTGDGWIHSVMNTNDAELVLYEHRIHQLCRDAHRTFDAAENSRKPARNGHPSPAVNHRPKKPPMELGEVSEMLYAVLSRVVATAAVLEDRAASQQQKDEALAAVRLEWQAVRGIVERTIQRQARFEYFQGVALGALVTIPVVALLGWLAVHSEATEFGRPASFTAAIVGGAVGAVISVTQRMSADTLVLDFTAPKYQKIVLGAMRPVVGAVFASIAYFVFISGLLAVEARTGDDVSAALAFFAVVGFAAGFSERFATDVLDRATGSFLPPGNRDQKQAGTAEEASMLLSSIPRRAEGGSVHAQGRPAERPPNGSNGHTQDS